MVSTLATVAFPMSLLILFVLDRRGSLAALPMVSGLIAGIPLLLLGYLIIDRWIKRRESARLAIIAHLAYKSLASGLREVIKGLAALSEDDTLVSVGIKSDPSPDWVETTYQGVGALRENTREVAADWTPLLLATEEGVAYLGGFVMMNRLLGDIRRSLDDFRDGEVKSTAEIGSTWITADRFARELSNDLWEACGSRLRFLDPDRVNEPVYQREVDCSVPIISR